MPARRLASLAVAVVTTTALTGGATAAHAASVPVPLPTASSTLTASGPALPTHDSFYRYDGSTPLAQVPAGTALRTRTVHLAVGTMTTPLTAEQILYRTTDELGRPSVTVTTVVSPTASVLAALSGVASTVTSALPSPTLPTPTLPITSTALPSPTIPTVPGSQRLVAYLSFYDALGPECDPSYTLQGGYAGNSGNEQQAEEEEAVIATYVAQGYTVTIPDFEGEALHWAAGQESGYGTLDAVRATESALSMPTATPVGLTGYSGGSIAADWASELAPRYSPEVDIVGVAEGGIPVDFAHNLAYINGDQDWAGVIPAVLVSESRAFGIDLDRYLSAYGKKITAQVSDECIGSFASHYPGLTIEQLLKPQYKDFLHVPVFRSVVNHLIMGSAPGHPTEPLYLAVGDADGTGDGIMVTKDVQALAYEYCQQGVPVTFQVFDGADHDQAALAFEPNASAFLQQRFAGAPAGTGNCGSFGPGNSLAPVS